MTAKTSRFDSAGWGAFFVIFVLVTALLGVWLYINRERDLSESRATAYVVAVFLGAIIAAILTTILNSILQHFAAKRAVVEDSPETTDSDSD